jgi:hypothetical protein
MEALSTPETFISIWFWVFHACEKLQFVFIVHDIVRIYGG